ncbi:MAG: glycosyltransferase family 2 protein [Imperialibacter sp.]|uniref:glycosyltransferase family 2 protein n=1 Tax=unclassified Imperialibacter TaxID=2629706 RepID=UPI00125396C5|nr:MULTISPECIES: glycosyltransferase [unclassified Imperialibacter]CAD5296588.1 putative Glycosyl transferase [Imperialibacter sp. 75]VVT33829.1 putative Glycosyl transferase family protein [Imperialibacter sp. EC-SDR9]
MSQPTPKVSVVIPAFNAEAYIRATIQSVLNQTFDDFEIVVVDDCSTDNTANVISSFDDKRIRLHTNEKNKGIAYTRNRLISLARAKYLAILDADDLAYPSRLQVQYDFLSENPDFAFAGSDIELIDTAGKTIGYNQYTYPPENYPSLLFFHNIIAQSSVMINRDYIESLPQIYSLDFPPAEDYHLWVRLALMGKTYNLPQVLVKYRIHSQSVSIAKASLMEQMVEKIILWQAQRLGLAPTRDELNIQKALAHSDYSRLGEISHLDIDRWLGKVFAANVEKQIYSQQSFGEVIKDKWIDLVHSRILEHSPRVFFELSKGFGFSKLTFAARVRFFLKCFLFYKSS